MLQELDFDTIFAMFQEYYICLIASIVFLVFSKLNIRFSKGMQKIFTALAIFTLMFAASEFTERLLGLLTKPYYLRKVLSLLNYFLKTFTLYLVLQIPTRHWSSLWKKINMIPLLITCVVFVIGLFTNLVIWYNPINNFVRGPLGIIPFITGGFYLAEWFIVGIVQIRKREYLEGFACAANAVDCGVVCLFEYADSLRGLMPNIMMIGLMFYYIAFLVGRYSHDELTSTYLRSFLFSDVEHITKKTYYISFDLNGLKRTNDTLGHKAGDKMLIDFTDAALDNLPSKGKMYRIGGDEFAVLMRTDDGSDVTSFIHKIRSRLAKEGDVTFSAGYTTFSSKKEFDHAFKEADRLLYEEKQNYYKEVATQK